MMEEKFYCITLSGRRSACVCVRVHIYILYILYIYTCYCVWWMFVRRRSRE
ncbi:hypothetical protein MOQ_001447, partial [Trypanosoma cruzi marinkellei]